MPEGNDETSDDAVFRQFFADWAGDHTPAWHENWPRLEVGELAPGQHYRVAVGLDAHGPRADVRVLLGPTDGLGSQFRLCRDNSAIPVSDRSRSDDRRLYCWFTPITVAHIELDTNTPPGPPAALAHDGAQLGLRVFLALVVDRSVIVNSAHLLDSNRRAVSVEDLRADQEDFALLLSDPQRWLDTRRTAAPGASTGGIYRLGPDGLPDPRGGRPFT